jgi:hypothetical protein
MCPCCNNKDFKKVEGFVCAECSFRYIAVKEDTAHPFKLTFCEKCGVTYSDGCPQHG